MTDQRLHSNESMREMDVTWIMVGLQIGIILLYSSNQYLLFQNHVMTAPCDAGLYVLPNTHQCRFNVSQVQDLLLNLTKVTPTFMSVFSIQGCDFGGAVTIYPGQNHKFVPLCHFILLLGFEVHTIYIFMRCMEHWIIICHKCRLLIGSWSARHRLLSTVTLVLWAFCIS